MHVSRWLIAGISLLIAFVLQLSPFSNTVWAHGELVSSSPPANAVLPNPPDEVSVSLTEAINLAFSDIKVFNKDGLRVDTQDLRPLGTTGIAVGLSPLEPGTYTVVWQATSEVDSHLTTGSFRFTVSGGGRLFLGTGGAVSQSTNDTSPNVLNTTIRWGELFTLSLMVGPIATLFMVWRPMFSGVSNEVQSLISSRLRFIALAGIAGLIIILIADLLEKAANADGIAFPQAIVGLLLGSPVFILRLALAALLGLLWFRSLKAEAFTNTRLLAGVLVLSILLMLGRSLQSHAAASQSNLVLSIASDFAHLLASGIWIGGLVALLGVFALNHPELRAGQFIRQAVSRFSNLAIVAILIVGMTGLYNAWVEVGSLRAFTQTPYGQLLLLKSAIFVPLLALGAVNLFGIRLGAIKESVGNIRKLVNPLLRAEVTLALVIFCVTALLANTPLAKDVIFQKTKASEAPMAMPVLLGGQDINITLGITPNQVGANTILLELTDTLGNPVKSNAVPVVRLTRLDQDIAVEPIELESIGEGRFSARTSALSIVGTWIAHVSMAIDFNQLVTVDYTFRVADRIENSESVIGGIASFLTGREPELPRTGPLIPSDDNAEMGVQFLQQADVSMNALESLHECNNINGVVTILDYDAPNLLRYTVKGGGTSVIQGAQQWYRRGDVPWREQPRSSTFSFPDFRYSDGASGVRMEGTQFLNGRDHQVVSFYSPRDDAEYWFWIDSENYRIGRLLMNVPPSHYMVSIFDKFNSSEILFAPNSPEDFSIIGPPISEKVTCQSYIP